MRGRVAFKHIPKQGKSVSSSREHDRHGMCTAHKETIENSSHRCWKFCPYANGQLRKCSDMAICTQVNMDILTEAEQWWSPPHCPSYPFNSRISQACIHIRSKQKTTCLCIRACLLITEWMAVCGWCKLKSQTRKSMVWFACHDQQLFYSLGTLNGSSSQVSWLAWSSISVTAGQFNRLS